MPGGCSAVDCSVTQGVYRVLQALGAVHHRAPRPGIVAIAGGHAITKASDNSRTAPKFTRSLKDLPRHI
jgi:hypothetical protein